MKKVSIFVVFFVVLVVSVLFEGSVLPTNAYSGGCNLAPNPVFEAGTSTSFEKWILSRTSGYATLSVSNYPSSVQSGDRAVKVSVTQPGDIYFHTYPSTIAVQPNTTYRFSARLLSSNGAQAMLRVIERNSAGGLVADRWLAVGGGTGDWVTLQSDFTTNSNTTNVRLRMNHHFSAGTFTWDDISFSMVESGKLCSDARHYVTQSTPGQRQCSTWFYTGAGNVRWCTDGHKDNYNEYIRTTGKFNSSNQYIGFGNADYVLHNSLSDQAIGVHKNLDNAVGWRCFAKPGYFCGAPASGANAAQYPPQTLPVEISLPVLNLASTPAGYNINQITPGAYLIHNWEKIDVRSLDPSNASQPAYRGSITHIEYAFIAQSVDFGGDVGIQNNVLIIESASLSGAINASGYTGGMRMERYFMVSGYGKLGQAGWEDTVCRNAPSVQNCDGFYNSNPGGLLTFPFRLSGDFAFVSSIAPYNAIDWWKN